MGVLFVKWCKPFFQQIMTQKKYGSILLINTTEPHRHDKATFFDAGNI